MLPAEARVKGGKLKCAGDAGKEEGKKRGFKLFAIPFIPHTPTIFHFSCFSYSPPPPPPPIFSSFPTEGASAEERELKSCIGGRGMMSGTALLH